MESPGDREGRGVPRGYVEQQKVDIPPASMAGRKAVAQSFASPVRMDVDFGVLSGWWRGLEVLSKGVHSFDAIFRAALELLESTKEQVRWFLNPSSTLPPPLPVGVETLFPGHVLLGSPVRAKGEWTRQGYPCHRACEMTKGPQVLGTESPLPWE